MFSHFIVTLDMSEILVPKMLKLVNPLFDNQ